VTITVVEAPEAPWTLSLRRPAWAAGANVTWPRETDGAVTDVGWSRRAVWRAGDRIVVELPMAPRLTEPDPRIDAIRCCIAIERGPLVYCLEEADLPEAVVLEDVRLDPASSLVDRPRDDLGRGAVGVAVGATVDRDPEPAWPYPTAESAVDSSEGARPAVENGFGEVEAVPYLHWANRGPGGMRVWVPRAEAQAKA
jgi:hypothetical protein